MLYLAYKDRAAVELNKKDAVDAEGISNLFKNLVQSLDQKESYTALKDYIKQIEKVENRFFKLLLELAVSLKAKNYGWSNRIVDALLTVNSYELLVKSVQYTMKEEEFVQLIELLLTKYQKETKKTIKTQMLANMFYHYGQSNNYKVLVNRFNSLWPLQEVREIIKKTMFASSFFDFWYIHLLNRTSDNNLRTLMRSMLSPEVIQKANNSQLWIFRYYYPGEPVLRGEIVKKLMKAWEGTSYADKMVVMSVMSNSVLKRDLAKVNNYFDKPLFQMKREFYNNQLNDSSVQNFALYQLTLLGDTNPENIWSIIQ